MYEGEKFEAFMHEEVIENFIELAGYQVKIMNEFKRISKEFNLGIPYTYTYTYYKYKQFNKFLEIHKKEDYKQIEELRRKKGGLVK